jgi:hypothetical protein
MSEALTLAIALPIMGLLFGIVAAMALSAIEGRLKIRAAPHKWYQECMHQQAKRGAREAALLGTETTKGNNQ